MVDLGLKISADQLEHNNTGFIQYVCLISLYALAFIEHHVLWQLFSQCTPQRVGEQCWETVTNQILPCSGLCIFSFGLIFVLGGEEVCIFGP